MSGLTGTRASGRSSRRLGLLVALALVALGALVLPSMAGAHSERPTTFPNPNLGNFPELRTDGPSLVVCKRDSRRRIQSFSGDLRRTNMKLLRRCRYHDIQPAVDAASNGYRIFVLPGVYTEERSLREPNFDPTTSCTDPSFCTTNESGDVVPTYQFHLAHPNAQNLIAILGDTNGDGICDAKCNLQIEGTGAKPSDVTIEGDRSSGPTQKLNGIRADRADGIYIKNLKTEFFDFNGFYVVETNGFRLDGVESGPNREYGILSFASDHGIYENCDVYGNGDSGVYPGSGPNGRHGMPDIHGHVYGIIIRNCNSHDNAMGYSGTAGNGVWAYHNRFHDNATGLVTDSLVPGHPGMPQDFAKWSENLFYSNNFDLFSAERDAYCQQPKEQRDLAVVCPSFELPVGTGAVIAGGNSDLTQNNYFFDNWRLGTMLFYVPAQLRGENDPTRQNDVSNNNRYEGNCVGVRPATLDPSQIDFTTCSGAHDPNGLDFWWDEQEGADCPEVDQNSAPCVDASDGLGNCWVRSGSTRNKGFNGAQPSADPTISPPVLPDCPGLDLPRGPNATKSAMLVPCATWDPQTNTDPPGCETPAGQSWFDRPPEPQP